MTGISMVVEKIMCITQDTIETLLREETKN